MTPPELRPYQTDIIARIETEIAAGRRRICLVAATGSGKTVIAAAVINKAVARLYELANAIGSFDATDDASRWALRETLEIFVRLIGPMTPHLAEELWQALGHTTLLADSGWPAAEDALLVDDTVTVAVQEAVHAAVLEVLTNAELRKRLQTPASKPSAPVVIVLANTARRCWSWLTDTAKTVAKAAGSKAMQAVQHCMATGRTKLQDVREEVNKKARTGWMLAVSVPLLIEVLVTAARIFAGLLGAFVLGAIVALLIGRSPTIESYVTPPLVFLQGIPALSWVVIAIIWFHGIEFRIFFIMVMTTLPAFTFQVLGALRGMSRDLMEMVFSFRPTRVKLFRVMIMPAILPDILTAWKVNLGNASRVVVVAELVGATGGIGYQLLQQQQLFDMAGALAWTLQLVFFVLIVQGALTLIENTAFGYRATSERAI